jgi:hypothetical protein
MLRFTTLKGLRLIAFASLFFGARAFAQFEVAPDHFDPAVSQKSLKKKALPAPSATTHSVTDSSAVAKATAPRDRQSSAQSEGRAVHGLHSCKSIQRRFDRGRVSASRKRPGKERIIAVSR